MPAATHCVRGGGGGGGGGVGGFLRDETMKALGNYVPTPGLRMEDRLVPAFPDWVRQC